MEANANGNVRRPAVPRKPGTPLLAADLKAIRAIANRGAESQQTRDLLGLLDSCANTRPGSPLRSQPALHTAITVGNMDDITMMLRLGFDANIKNSAGDSALQLAINTSGTDSAVVSMLLYHGAKPEPSTTPAPGMNP